MSITREYEAWCGACGNHWYLRLRGIDDPTPLVTCPRCNHDGIANELDPPWSHLTALAQLDNTEGQGDA